MWWRQNIFIKERFMIKGKLLSLHCNGLMISIFTVLLTAGCLLVLSGCQNPVRSSGGTRGTGDEAGFVILNIGGSFARTILPDTELDDFEQFRLTFIPRNDNSTPGFSVLLNEEEWEGDWGNFNPSSVSVQVPRGQWYLIVTAYLPGHPASFRLAAMSVQYEIAVTAAGIAHNVMLLPILDGTGTFSWVINLLDAFSGNEIDMDESYISITPFPVGTAINLPVGSLLDGTISGSYTLASDMYHVVLTLVNNYGYAAEISDILQVFQNMESSWEVGIGNTHFIFPRVINEDGEFGIGFSIVNKTPDIITVGGVTTVSLGGSLELGVTGGPFASYRWFYGGTQIVGAAGNSLVFDAGIFGNQTGTHFVTVVVEYEVSLGEVRPFSRRIEISVVEYLRTILSVTNASQWNEALNIISSGGDNQYYAITVSGNVAIPGTAINSFGMATNLNVLLQGNGNLSLSSNGSIIRLGSEQRLIINSESLTLQGRNNNNNPVVYIQSGGTLELKSGSISGNTVISSHTANIGDIYGSGVHVGSGTFIMSGGKIVSNTAYTSWILRSSYGSGVYVGSGTFIMKGGEISGNIASSSFSWDSRGGGVYIGSGAFTMSGGRITGNTASSTDSSSTFSSGGGVFVATGTFTMSGGEISGNTASADNVGADNHSGASGGGVRVISGTFIMEGGEISGNTASASISGYSNTRSDSQGGGVHIGNGGIFTMGGGIITGNTASFSSPYPDTFFSILGGGVYVDRNGAFTKSGGGIITGYHSSSEPNGNVAKFSGLVQSNSGHAVAAGNPVNWFNHLRRESTAGAGVNLDSAIAGATGGWEN